jgi:thiol-disulfide isomerase/thioredoxin
MNKSWIRPTVVLVLTLFTSLVHAATEVELRVFGAKSFAEIKQARAGKPFILAFWSITCEPCREEMMVVTEVHKKYPGIPIVLVAADSPNTQQQVRRFLSNYALGRIQTWQFGGESPERLRYSVDKAWAGEVPRSYLFNSKHEVTAHSGVVELKDLHAWAEREARASK